MGGGSRRRRRHADAAPDVLGPDGSLAFAVASRSNLSIVRAVYTRLIHLPMSYFSARKAGDVTSRLEEHGRR